MNVICTYQIDKNTKYGKGMQLFDRVTISVIVPSGDHNSQVRIVQGDDGVMAIHFADPVETVRQD